MSPLSIVWFLVFVPGVTICFQTNEYIFEQNLQKKVEEMRNDLFEQVIQTSIDEEILALMPIKEAEGHINRDSRSRRVLRSIQSESCQNALDDTTCKYLRLNGECKTKQNEMKLYCPDTCGFCGTQRPRCLTTRFGCCADGKTIARGSNSTGCPENCQDKQKKKFCKSVRRLSMCFAKELHFACNRTCGYCRPCEDDHKYRCYYAAKYGSCKSLKSLMMNECRKSCSLCGTKDLCHNHPCPLHSTCVVNNKGQPSCVCGKKCHKGDHHTGPVCARNGVTYQNLCKLKQNVCHKYHHITVRSYGKCQPNLRKLRSLHCSKVKKDSPDCKVWKLSGFCETRISRMTVLCPNTCNFCGNQHPQPACHYSKYGCCLDNRTTCKGIGYQGCPNKKKVCRDKSRILCRRFVAVCGHKNHSRFLKLYCPKTCMFC